ncbi:MAG: sigma-70 family RNA polymerase sigma factor [Alphaproteobacteria bacterium]|nr:sigma-70 family RNA polymerase sigma factor [Alphaproteobacteria bacterium]
MFNDQTLIDEIPNLRKFALKLARDRNNAEDLLQATVLRALEKRHLFNEGTSMFSWASKTMYNLFVSDYRRKTKFETQYDPETHIAHESVGPNQEAHIEFKEVQEAMNMLSDDHREILVMVCVKNMQYAEVSEALQIPIGTVRSRLSRARESLQQALETPKVYGRGTLPNQMGYAPHHYAARAAA